MKHLNLHIIVFFVTQFLLGINGFATTYTTISAGYWNDASSWMNGDIPLSISADSILIKHPITTMQDLTFDNGTYLEIESQGGLCGHQNIYVNNGSIIKKYGTFQIDSLFIYSSQVECYAPGEFIATSYVIISGVGGSFNVSGCSAAVGPWFECRPIFHPLEIVNIENAEFSLYPNPATTKLNISAADFKIDLVRIYTPEGKQVRVYQSYSLNEIELDVSGLSKGIYLISLSNSSILKIMRLAIE